jgi:hypothetical protein
MVRISSAAALVSIAFMLTSPGALAACDYTGNCSTIYGTSMFGFNMRDDTR